MSRSITENSLLYFIRTLSTPRTARLAYRHAKALYPGKKTGNRLRLYLRTLLSIRHTADWYAHMDHNRDLRRCYKAELELAQRIHRPYRRASLTVAERFSLLLQHNQISGQLGWLGIIADAYTNTLELARFADRNGQEFSLKISRPAQFGKEGELALHLSDDTQRLYSTCFAFRETDGQRELDIGCIQGPAHEDGQNIIRSLTRNLHGLRPRSLILEALRSLAANADCSRLRMVGNSEHIYRNRRKQKSIAFDYDGFCSEIEDATADGTDWLLPLTATQRPLNEIASKKRAETTRRRNLLESIGQQISGTIAGKRSTPQTI